MAVFKYLSSSDINNIKCEFLERPNYMIYRFILLISVVTVVFMNTLLAGQNPNIDLAYPSNNAKINSNSTFLIGNTLEGSKLFVNDEPVKVYDKGIFVHIVKLKSGKNSFKIKAIQGNISSTKEIVLNVPSPESALSSRLVSVSVSSMVPSGNLIYPAGELVNFMFKATPGLKASIKIGDKVFPAIELQSYIDNVKNLVLGKVYGVQQYPVKGYYTSVVPISSSDNFLSSPIKIALGNGKGKTKTFATSSKLTKWNPDRDPKVAQITVNNATIRTGSYESRLTPLPKGVRILLSGYENGTYRFKMGPFLDGYIKESNVKILPKGTPVPFSKIRNFAVRVIQNSTYVIIPVTTRLPFNISQSVDQKILTLFVYGAKADTDLIRYDLNGSCIDQVKWNQPYTNVYQLDVLLKQDQQWGYDAYYSGYEEKGNLALVLKIKNPPLINQANPLKDKTIVIDPGHGGTELGSVGPGLVPEKDVNLAISVKLAELLKECGARPILTRNKDIYLSLNDRTNFAKQQNADIFISIHNNALPDGRNPLTEHGSSTYYYHPMAYSLAKSIQKSFLKELEFPNFGLYYDNLAITRENSLPSVLLEVGFMINPEEYLYLTNKTFQTKAAVAIEKGISEFFLKHT